MSDKVLSTEKDKKKMSSNQPKWIKVRVPSTEVLDKISIRIISKNDKLQQLALNIVLFVISGEFLFKSSIALLDHTTL